jgi:hypothetical protein
LNLWVYVGSAALVAVVAWLDVGRRRLVRARREAEAAQRQLDALLQWRLRAAHRLAIAATNSNLSERLRAVDPAAAWAERAAAESRLTAALAAELSADATTGDPDLADVCARLAAFAPVWQVRIDRLVAARAGLRGRFLARTFAPSPPPVRQLTLTAEAAVP